MSKPCSEAGCTKPARARGLCPNHYAKRWVIGALPPKQRRETLHLSKIYLTKQQIVEVRRLAERDGKTMSVFLRELVSKFISDSLAS